MTRECVYEQYAKSVLIFPSYIETLGLPLLEARLTGCPIIAADTPFAKEILDGYNNVAYFGQFDSIRLYQILLIFIQREKK